MDYFISCLYGDLNAYKKIKKSLTEFDNLWIIGDIFDGNTKHPEYCIDIFKDICRSPNIHLILGDHEYFHAMRLFAETEEERDMWEESLIECDISGKPLVDYLNSLSEEEQMSIGKYLLGTEVSDMLKFGNNFFYVCHGCPNFRTKVRNGNMQWQLDVVTGYPEFDKDYGSEISSDIHMEDFSKKYGEISLRKNLITIMGHVPNYMLRQEGVKWITPDNNQNMAFICQDRKINLNQNITADDNYHGPRYLLGIDAAGFIVKDVEV